MCELNLIFMFNIVYYVYYVYNKSSVVKGIGGGSKVFFYFKICYSPDFPELKKLIFLSS